MNSIPRALLRQCLDHLCSVTKAKNCTCHFYNPYSNLYWLFEKGGKFDFPYQLCGPLTHSQQADRFIKEARESPDAEPGMKIEFFDDEQIKHLAKRILAAPSFFEREKIKTPVRITLFDPEREPQAQANVVVFVNFIGPIEDERSVVIELVKQLRPLRPDLLKAADGPYLDDKMAWILRSTGLRLRQKLEELRLTTEKPQGEDAEKKLFDWIAEVVAKDLVNLTERGAALLSCTICRVAADEPKSFKTLGNWSPKHIDPGVKSTPGIVNNVAHTGQVFYVDNVKKYSAKWEELNKTKSAILQGNSTPMPQYEAYDSRTKCELAVPLIAQGRVVGVINLEADKPGVFNATDVLALSHFGSSVALVIRLVGLLKDTSLFARFHHEISMAKDRGAVLKELLTACRELGHGVPRIWDNHEDAKQWIDDPKRSSPRTDGFTLKIASTKEPLAVVDAVYKSENEFEFKVLKRGDCPTFFSPDDKRADLAINGLPQELKQELETDHNLTLTGLGFPILGSADRKDKETEAVLWLNCPREYSTLLDDDVWCISLLSQLVSSRLSEIALRRELERQAAWSDTRRRTAVSTVLKFHFGKPRADELLKLQLEELMTARIVSDVIVLNMDIRGSSELVAKVSSNPDRGRPKAFADFLKRFFVTAQQRVHANHGIFDKTMGDGFQALFNLYRKKVFAGMREISQEVALEGVAKCMHELCMEFDKLRRDSWEEWDVVVDGDFALCAGLSEGTAFVGGFSYPAGLPGFEFSAHGPPANTAAKFQGCARRTFIQKIVSDKRSSFGEFPKKGPDDPNRRNKYRGILETKFQSYSVVQTSFARKPPLARFLRKHGSLFRLPTKLKQPEPDLAVLFVPRMPPSSTSNETKPKT